MKKTTASNLLHRTAALLLALLLAVPPAYASAGARKLQTLRTLAEGLTYGNTVSENAGSRVESFSLERSPYSAAYPILLQGSGSVYGAATLSTAVSYAQSLGYHVLGAVNTDFFATSSGVPLGIVIENGIYKSSAEKEAAMAVVGGQVQLVEAPRVDMGLTNQRTGAQTQPHHFNKLRTASGGLYLLNRDFGATTAQSSGAGWYVRMRLAGADASPDPSGDMPDWLRPYEDPSPDPIQTPDVPPDLVEPDGLAAPLNPGNPENSGWEAPSPVSGPAADGLTVNSALTLEVVELVQGDQPIAIGADEYILTSADESGYISVFQSFQVGDRVTLATSCGDAVLASAQWAGGVGDVMVRDGALTNSAGWTYTKTGRAPRTALGVKADGTLVVYAVDGRQSGYSMGLSQMDLAQELLAQGCRWAANLDGGGSTALSVWVPGQEGPALQNKPSDGVQRKCATFLLLVTDGAGNGAPSRLALREDGQVVLAGSRLTLPEAVALDGGLNVLPLAAEDLTIASNGLGTVEEGVYTAGPQAGTDTLYLSSPSLAVAGTAPVHVVDALTGLTVSREKGGAALSALTVKPGESVQLAVRGTYWGRTALRDWSAVAWSVEGGVGSVDENGLFTMGEAGGSGSITAHAGGKSQTIQISTPYTHSDVPREHWAYEAVEYCYSHGVVNGISASEFGAALPVSRCDFVLMFHRAAGKPAAGPCTFTDVPADAYYAEALAWAQGAGLSAGVEDGAFRPTEPATREEAFTMLRQVMPLLGKACPEGDPAVLESFADRDQIAGYAREPIAALVSLGIVNGKGAGVDPKGGLTRAEMAKLLYEALTYEPGPDTPAGPTEPSEPTEPTEPSDSGQTAPEGAALTLDRTEAVLAPAESLTLQAALVGAPADAQVAWTSSNPAAAPVTAQGTVTNIHPSEEGTQVVITARWNGLEASCTVQCQPAVFIGTVVDAENGLNVRSGPGTGHPVTGGLAGGSRVVVVSITKNGWYHIHYLHKDGYAAEGYVSGDYLQLNRE